MIVASFVLALAAPFAGAAPASIDSPGAVRSTPGQEVNWKASWLAAPVWGEALSLEGLNWVWTQEGDARASAPAGEACFRRIIRLPEPPTEATFLLAADNAFSLHINGIAAGQGAAWERPVALDVQPLLRKGENTLAVVATNTAPSPAGLVGILSVGFEDGQRLQYPVDATWRASGVKDGDWTAPAYDDSVWKGARAIAAFGQEPWTQAASTSELRRPLPIFRKTVTLEKAARRADAYICGLGHYELRVNGETVSTPLAPSWSDYRDTCFYNLYPVVLNQGENTIAVLLGNGMYNVTGGRYTKFTGSFGEPKFILQVEGEYENGEPFQVVSDASWSCADGPITFSCVYGGEDYDARHEPRGWDTSGYVEDEQWRPAKPVDGPGGELHADIAPPIAVRARHVPVAAPVKLGDGYLYDLGINFSGWPRIEVSGEKGAVVRLTPAERLVDGAPSQSDSGSPFYWEYTLAGTGREAWAPRFTYYGFRWVLVEGAHPEGANGPGAVLESIRGEELATAVAVDGEFRCSNELLNGVHRIIKQAIVSNMKSVLTDCPHREKLGWLEEVHLMGPSIMYNFGVSALYRKIGHDMRDAQLDNGLVPDIAPEFTVFDGGFRDSPEWGSACILAPWYAYEFYGDRSILEQNYAMMKRYEAYLDSKADGGILTHGLGDWADVGPNPPASHHTPQGVTATAIYYQDLATLSEIAQILGEQNDARAYAEKAGTVRAAFNARFYNAGTHQYATGSQAANGMALVLDLVPEEDRAAVLENLVADVRARGNHTTAGDVGHRYVLVALAEGGRSDVVYDMVTQTDYPSYGYQVEHGATSLTEAWDGPTRGWSQNHFMLGHVMEWFYRYLAGIQPAEPGFKRVVIRPAILRGLDEVHASYNSMHGMIESGWKREGDTVTLRVTIPPDSTGTVYLPVASADRVTHKQEGITNVREEDGNVVCDAAPGKYVFEYGES